MLNQKEMEQSPLFQDITYEQYRRMMDCFQAVQKSYRADELIYDFTAPGGNAVGIVDRGTALLIRIDEDGVATVLEELGPGGVFGRNLAFAATGETAWRWCAVPAAMCFLSTMSIFSSAVSSPAHTTASWCRICCG